MALEITVLSGIDVFWTTFNAVATFINHEGWHSLVAIAETMGIIACIVSYIKTHDLRQMAIWGLLFVIVNAMLLTPKTNIIIRDLTRPTAVRTVSNVPVGLAVPFWFITDIGNGLARTYDDFFHSVDDLKYTKTGLLFGSKLLEDSFSIRNRNPDFLANFNDYTTNCIIPDIQLNNKYTFSTLAKSTDLNSVIFANPSPVRGIYYQSGTTSTYLSCKQAADKLKAVVNSESSNSSSESLIGLAQKFPLGGTTAEKIAMYPNSVSNIYSALLGVSSGAVNIFKQNMLINALRTSLNNYPASLDSSADMIGLASEQSLIKMKLSQLSSYEIASQMLPLLHTVFLIFLVSIFPVMVLALFFKELAWGVVKNYLNVLGSLMLWSVLFAVFNHIITSLASHTLQGEPFTLSNADNLAKNASSMAGMASWLMVSIPFISFRLFTGLGNQIASAGSYLGNALMSATSADAAAVASGNLSFGNMQMQNVNGFKTDLNRSFLSGMDTVQAQSGARKTITEDGQVVYDTTSAISKLPFSVDWGKMLDSSLIKSAQMAERQTESFQQAYRQSTAYAHDLSSNLSKQLAHSEMGSQNISSELKQSIDDIARLSQSAQQSMSSASDTTRRDNTATQYANTGGFGGSVGAGLGKLGASASAGYNINDYNSDEASKSHSASESFRNQEDWTNSKSAVYIKSLGQAELDQIQDSNVRTKIESLQNALRNTSENFSQYTTSKSREFTISQTANMTDSERLNMVHRLEQEFVGFVHERLSPEQADYVLTNTASSEARLQREALLAEFSGTLVDRLVSHNSNSFSGVQTPSNNHNHSINPTKMYDEATKRIDNQEQQNFKKDVHRINPSSQVQDMKTTHEAFKGITNTNIKFGERDFDTQNRINNERFNRKN